MPVNSFDNYPLTWKPDKSRLKPPIYLSLVTLLEEDVADGKLLPGTKLPPQRELADYLDINFTTVTRAFDIARSKGLLHGVTGRGTFISPRAAELVTIHEKPGRDNFISMGYIASFEHLNTIVADAARRVMMKDHFNDLLAYRYWLGWPHHFTAARRWLDGYGVHVDDQHMSFVYGATNGMSIILAALFKPGDTIAVEEYSFSNFIELARIFHISLVPVRTDQQGMIPDELDRACRLNSVQGVYLMPSCSNPTTVCIPADRRRELAKVIKKHKLTVIEDDYSADLPSPDLPSFFELLPEQTCFLCGASKILCTGLRVSFLAYGEAYRERIVNALYNMVMTTSSLDVEIISELIMSGDGYRLALKKHEMGLAVNKIFDEYFPQWTEPDKYSFHRWLPFPSDKKGALVESELLDRGVELFHSYHFYVPAKEEQHFLRIALTSPGSNEKLRQGLAIIRNYYQELGLLG